MAKITENDIKKIIKKMTLAEKCSLLSGKDFWRTKELEKYGIPSIMVSDGPHGLRRQLEENSGVNDSIQAVCFPAACATSSSFDRNIMKELGEILGDQCLAQNVQTILGPAVNIKRSPLCGRNFEYISEDPYAAGELAASYINGVQSKNIGTSIKHFALNNQEYRRLTNSSNCDERTIREIYLPAFEIAVKKSQPYTIMHSYNKINGEYAGESKWLLDDVLRKEWGFEGLVMSDWGAVDNRAKGVEAGGDLEMPSSHGINDKKVEEAVKKGLLDEKAVDTCVERILKWVFKCTSATGNGEFDLSKHHEVARKIEEESIVLLKNNGVLPLAAESKNSLLSSITGKSNNIAVIGEYAVKPRFQGGGSSHINTKNVRGAVEVLKSEGIDFKYAKGFSADDKNNSEELLKEALALAKRSRVAIIFAGLPDSYESEGYDRTFLELPEVQNKLISEISTVNKNTIVVLHNGSPVTMPWIHGVNAVVEAYLGGEAVAEAVVNILLGKVNPSGKLSETFPLKIQDTPCYLDYAFDKRNTNYREGIFVGYRYYDKKQMDVLFPFGYGLSYTNFEYSSISLSKTSFKDDEEIVVSIVVRNTGAMDGKETVQLYVQDLTNSAIRPVKELKGFEKLFIKAGSSAKFDFTINKRSLAWYSTDLGNWYAASGKYRILAGSSSRDIHLEVDLTYETTDVLPLNISENTTVGDLLSDSRTKDIIMDVLSRTQNTIDQGNEDAREAISEEMVAKMLDSNPLRNIKAWHSLSDKEFNNLLDDLKKACGENIQKKIPQQTKRTVSPEKKTAKKTSATKKAADSKKTTAEQKAAKQTTKTKKDTKLKSETSKKTRSK